MAVITDPLALATRGVIKTGGKTDPLGLATFGVIVVDGVVVVTPQVGSRKLMWVGTMGWRREA